MCGCEGCENMAMDIYDKNDQSEEEGDGNEHEDENK